MNSGRSGRGPDNGHVASDHVPELRNLVQPDAPHDPPDARDAGVPLLCPQCLPRLLCVLTHRPELEHRERLPEFPDANLPEDHRAR